MQMIYMWYLFCKLGSILFYLLKFFRIAINYDLWVKNDIDMGCVWIGLMRSGFGLICLVKYMTK
jgi:hypothetical protein